MWPKLVIGLALRTGPGRRAARNLALAGTVAAVGVIAVAGAAGYLGYRWWEAREKRTELESAQATSDDDPSAPDSDDEFLITAELPGDE